MRSVSGRELARIVERRGWTLLRVSGSHHIYGKPGSIVLPEIEPSIWAVFEAGNRLRNQIAHSPDDGKIAAKMATLRKSISRRAYARASKSIRKLERYPDCRVGACPLRGPPRGRRESA
jgi:hypothetical protein